MPKSRDMQSPPPPRQGWSLRRRAVATGAAGTIICIVIGLASASADGLSGLEVLFVVVFFVVTGALTTAAGYQEETRRRSAPDDPRRRE